MACICKCDCEICQKPGWSCMTQTYVPIFAFHEDLTAYVENPCPEHPVSQERLDEITRRAKIIWEANKDR